MTASLTKARRMPSFKKWMKDVEKPRAATPVEQEKIDELASKVKAALLKSN